MDQLDNVAKFLQGKTIFVTGGTGFLAKIFVEKVLRLQPNVNKIYLLLRAPDAKSATKRLHSEVISTELFRILRDKWGSKFDHFISTKVIAVPGDISSLNLGVNESKLQEEMFKEIDIVVNSAATTDFIERYDVALGINTFGPFNVMSFAKKCDNIKLFLHVSTAYVCGEGTGLILEKPFQMDETLKKTCNKLDITEEKRLMEETLEELISQCASNEIPGDMVVNAMVVAMVLHHKNHHQTYDDDEANIYHVSSSLRNPLRFSDLHNIVYNYFTKNPWINKRNGQRIKVGKGTVLSTADRYFLYMNIKYVLPLKKLRMAAKEEGIDLSLFNFDSKTIDWDDYMMNVHIPGLSTHVIKS
ncbi:Male sterility, NAD-binding protein [Corchorus olitorius]|uniref:Fatty acyl-CoA reductase n=2 Tax=Corchorus olitorius TaxID=93759 RepID=A0A1R3J2Y8_9ROSI|nr:Male sterility, NAD-binding protein [Corchorus olitorius]